MNEVVALGALAVLALALRSQPSGGMTGLDEAGEPPPGTDRQSDIRRGEAEGQRRLEDGTLDDSLAPDVRDPSEAASGIIVGTPLGGERRDARVWTVAHTADTARAIERLWQPLHMTGAGFEFRDENGKLLVLIEQPEGVFYVAHLRRTQPAEALVHVGYLARPEFIRDPERPRLWTDADPLVPNFIRDLSVTPEGFANGPQALMRAVLGELPITQHMIPPVRPEEAMRLGAREHPARPGQPWRVYAALSNRSTDGGEPDGRPRLNGNPDWSWWWWSPCYPEHRENTAGVPDTFEPHVGGGSRCTAGFAEWAVDFLATGTPPALGDQWVGANFLGQPDGPWPAEYDRTTGLMRRVRPNTSDALVGHRMEIVR